MTTQPDHIAKAMKQTPISSNESTRAGEPANVVDALFAIARSIDGLAYQVKYLGNGDAASPMGAIEALGATVKEGMSGVADALNEIARSND